MRPPTNSINDSELIVCPAFSTQTALTASPNCSPSMAGICIPAFVVAPLLGVGLGRGRQKFLYLPEQYNDFIFSVICEELGLIGACVIMLIFSMLILRGFWIALHARDRFGALLVVGVMTHLALQTFLNIAVVSGFVPTTGISLPFFSYGGTALCLQLVEMGIVLSVSRQIPAARAG